MTTDLIMAGEGIEAELMQDIGIREAFRKACYLLAKRGDELGRMSKDKEKIEALLAESEADRQFMRNKLARAGL